MNKTVYIVIRGISSYTEYVFNLNISSAIVNFYDLDRFTYSIFDDG